ncbi:hypothetical protein ACWDTT_02360 [Streptosporangium sandarakinum]|uniref:hypothetical protein n=1 Tax=Streptosporangium TaxID=2000 RepID=UPI0031F94A0C
MQLQVADGLAGPLIGHLADVTSLRTALIPLILMPVLSWLLFRTLPEPAVPGRPKAPAAAPATVPGRPV